VAAATLAEGQRSSGAPDNSVPPPDGPVPPRTGNQPIMRFCAHTLFTVRCAPDSPVHPRTEGNQGLLNGAPTAPRSLGAIKRTPRRMELYTKQSLNILQRQDIEFSPLL
jgi:hypothetical protein